MMELNAQDISATLNTTCDACAGKRWVATGDVSESPPWSRRVRCLTDHLSSAIWPHALLVVNMAHVPTAVSMVVHVAIVE
jgi:hypothetical protein